MVEIAWSKLIFFKMMTKKKRQNHCCKPWFYTWSMSFMITLNCPKVGPTRSKKLGLIVWKALLESWALPGLKTNSPTFYYHLVLAINYYDNRRSFDFYRIMAQQSSRSSAAFISSPFYPLLFLCIWVSYQICCAS